MKLEDWLRHAGLEGKKLQIAVDSCETNVVETVAELRSLAKDEKQFNLAFPQAMIRSVLLKALHETPEDPKEAGVQETSHANTKTKEDAQHSR